MLRLSVQTLLLATLSVALLCGWLFWKHSDRLVFLPYELKATGMEDWKTFGGTWEMTNRVVRNNSDERGAKLVTGSPTWKDYTLRADLKFDGEHGDMGVLIRSSGEEEGVDAYSGYYAGLRTTDGTLVIGRSDFGWMEARPVPMPGGVHANTWYSLTVTAVGCSIAASSQNLTTMQTAWVALEEKPCATAGRIGLRSLATGGMWRNIGVERATASDLLKIRSHVDVVGKPEFPGREADYNRIFRFSPTYSSPVPGPVGIAQPQGQSLHIADLQNLPRNEGSWVVLRGVVTLTSPDLYIQDSGSGIQVKDAEIPPLNVGDAVEVAGYAQSGLYSALIRGGNVRLLWSGTPIPPIAITTSQAASGAYDSRFVEIEGRLTGITKTIRDEQALEFSADGQSFSAVYADHYSNLQSNLQIGSLLRIRGICVLDRSVTREINPFVLLLRSSDDLQTLSGPPWWTPWHVGMLFACVIALVVLLQQVYFRIHQWQANALTEERERLAHEIHDTMAQSFAGVGYQIQGIRSGVVRGDHKDSQHIAEQLSVAYQLVRKCHEEASRTISMLGVSTPEIQGNLLGALADTARKIVGDQIEMRTRLEGNAFELDLRLANCLLHIGQEAIANAVSHGDPTVLTIALRYLGASVELIVEDNGKGFSFTSESAGFGILGMQKRAREVGGQLEIVSTPGQGTLVRMLADSQPTSLRSRIQSKTAKELHSLAALIGISRRG